MKYFKGIPFFPVAESAALLLTLFLILTPWTEAGASSISVVNVSDGAVYSKQDDTQAGSELVDINLEMVSTGLPDGKSILVKVQGTVTVGGQVEPGIINEYSKINQGSCSLTLPLFPGQNTISIYVIPDDYANIYVPRSKAKIAKNLAVFELGEPSVTLIVTSSYQSSGDDLNSLISEEQYNQITANSRDNAACRESAETRAVLELPETINGQWYYTYENFINAMRKVPKFAGEGDLNTRKLELAAFFANVAQETGSGGAYGAGCAIQEGYGSIRKSPDFGGLAPTGAGYCGRGPLQLTHDVNYRSFGEDMGVGDLYVNDPDLLTKHPEVGLAGSMWFWNHREPQWDCTTDPPFKPSCHEVMVGSWEPTANDIAGGRTVDRNFGVVINIINGGLECGDAGADAKAKAQNRVNYFRAIADILGAVIPGLSDILCKSHSV